MSTYLNRYINLYKYNIYLHVENVISQTKWTVKLIISLTFKFHRWQFYFSSLSCETIRYLCLLCCHLASSWSWNKLCRRHCRSVAIIFLRDIFPFHRDIKRIRYLTWKYIKLKSILIIQEVINESKISLNI